MESCFKEAEESLTKAFKKWREDTPKRGYVIRTGKGGMESINVAMEEAVGLKRVYLGVKIPRILRRLNFTIKTNLYGKFYKLVRV